MIRVMLAGVLLGVIGGGCGGGGGSCDLPAQWSSAKSGGMCQVNFFTTPERAVYCLQGAGTWDCACGPAVDNPPRFTSPDFCDLEPEERACQAIEACNFPL